MSRSAPTRAIRTRDAGRGTGGVASGRVVSSPRSPSGDTSRDLLDMVGIARGEITAERELVLEIGRTYHLLMKFIAETLDRVGLTPQQYGILEVLLRRPEGVAQDELRAIMVCSRPNLSGLVDRMVKSGLIAGRTSTTDRRCRILTATKRGAAMVRRARPAYRRALHALFLPVPLTAKTSLTRLVREIRGPLEALSSASRGGAGERES